MATSSFQAQQNLLKRSSEGFDNPNWHASTCGCPICYERKINSPPSLQLRRSADFIKKPILQAVCHPVMETFDVIIDGYEKAENKKEVKRYEKEHKKWLKKQQMESSTSDGPGRRGAASSSSEGRQVER